MALGAPERILRTRCSWIPWSSPPIPAAARPHSGVFTLATLAGFNGGSMQGTWTLTITDAGSIERHPE